jgi:hypothetical protein
MHEEIRLKASVASVESIIPMWMPCEWYIQDLDANRRTMCTKSYLACMTLQAENYHASMLPPHCHCTPMLWP